MRGFIHNTNTILTPYDIITAGFQLFKPIAGLYFVVFA